MCGSARASEVEDKQFERQFGETVRPFLKSYCVSCHGKDEPEGEFDLRPFATVDDVAKGVRSWEIVLERLAAKEMPPEDAERQPTADERKAVVEWIRRLRKHLAQQNAGDPGPVLARRLSNAEYDYTIRDLTGVDIRPTREFPVDPANEAGFDNSGESLAMSPALFKKYLAAAREVSEHVVLKPSGFAFAPHPVVTDTDRDKYCVRRIVEFYQRQPTDFADYFLSAWRYHHRAALGKPDATLKDIAAEDRMSPKYLEVVWSTLTESEGAVGPIAKLQAMWRALPAPSDAKSEVVREGCVQMRDFVIQLRAKLAPEFENLRVRGMHAGSQPLVLWKNRQYAAHRRSLDIGALQVEGQPLAGTEPTDADRETSAAAEAQETAKDDEKKYDEPDRKKTGSAKDNAGKNDEEQKYRARQEKREKERLERERRRKEEARRKRATPDPDLRVPADPEQRALHEAAFRRFCSVFPDAFFILERGRMYLDQPDEMRKGRLLSAGFHSMMGYFRDDVPLCELILDDESKRELDRLWQELDFIARAPIRQHTGFIWFERTDSRFMISEEFDFARAEDKDAASEAKIRRLAEVYLAKARGNGGGGEAIKAVEDHFDAVNRNIRWVEQSRLDAEPSHLEALLEFAGRAYRRPLSQAERDDILGFYRLLRTDDELDHEEAIRETIVSILVSPHFCYRIDLPPAGAGPQPLSDYELASRLSYFLWSSMPDRELLDRAAAGDLHQPDVLIAQARRMLRDQRVRGLATEFGGNWLDFRRFEEHNSVDRERFKSFDNELRTAMFQEPIRFFVDLVERDRSILDFLYADHTFVNAALAKHYGLHDLKVGANEWVRVDEAHRHQRGGLLPMSVFLTKNAPGLRTSPVKRGYWVVRRLLGEQIPPPPPDVPELPDDEGKLGELTLREMLAQHRDNKACAGCHARFDSVGLVFEGYGPIGELRDKDLGGKPVETGATFPGGSTGAGLEGLRTYLREHRQDDFVDNLCRKLLAYALGRGLQLSDDPAIDQMRARLAANGYRFSSLVESIVTSPQFLTKRAGDASKE
jgi:hypothetical protein